MYSAFYDRLSDLYADPKKQTEAAKMAWTCYKDPRSPLQLRFISCMTLADEEGDYLAFAHEALELANKGLVSCILLADMDGVHR